MIICLLLFTDCDRQPIYSRNTNLNMEHLVQDDAGETIRLIDMGDNFKLSVYGTAQSTKEVFDAVPDYELRPDDL